MSRGQFGWKSRARRFADLLAENGNVKSDRVDIAVPEATTWSNLIDKPELATDGELAAVQAALQTQIDNAGGDTVNVTETVIWSGNYLGTGNITLNQSMLNFDFIALFGGNDHCGNNIHPAASFVNNSNSTHSYGWLFCSYSSTHLWYKANSATSIRITRGNSRCRYIVGYNLT